ncbi:HEAT repeat domain-containing protein [Corallococcus carmarthensis]|uniref:HEAT repeat domain-containing protein n=1 Tax=Corallococcus carmarthensis TaxID=2316728 RepID=UPI00148E7055|nr:HEAT repeat domain-containing protein [Corallococcus carmarthensis]NOK19686.1 HEAT repeat domain-containing protein [Corallococcus carmarthensis]
MNTRRMVIGGALLALLTLGVVWVGLGQAAPSEASPDTVPLRFRFPEGQHWTYQLDYQAQSRVRLSGQGAAASSLAGQIHLAGDLVLRGHGARGATQWVGLRLERLQTHSLKVLGHELLPDAASVEAVFGGREALLELSGEGTLQAVSFREEDPALFKNTVQSLVGELQVVLRDGASWSEQETTARGIARTEYEKLGEDAEAVRLLKRRAEYVELRGMGQGGTVRLASRFEADVAREGVLERLAGTETVERLGADGTPSASSEVRVSLKRGASGRFVVEAPVDASALQRLAPGVLVVDPKVRAQMLAQQVDGLTAEQLFSLLEAHADGGIMPDHNHFLLQATGLLEQQPELCARLVDFFERPSLQPKGRALVLDLLAGAGTPRAQEALVRALSTKAAREDSRYGLLLSRLSLVAAPTVDTVRFAERTYAQTQGTAHIAGAYALGATAGALYRQEQTPEARAAVGRLASDLRAASSPEEQAHLLLGLGNAGVADQVPLIASHATAQSPEVRRASAKALRKIPTPEATQVLLTLASDGAVPVQSSALESLGRRPLDEGMLMDLRDLTLSGGVKAENYHALVSLVAPYVDREPAVRELLEYLLTRDVPDRQVLMRIRGLLKS